MKGLKLLLLLTLSLLLLLPSPLVSSFGGEPGFGEEEILFEEAPAETFFIHDTLRKSLFLIIFILSALLIHQYRRDRRRLLLLFSFLALGLYVGGFLCPLSAVQNVLYRYRTFFLLLFLLPLLLALFRGRLYCGYVCPFGAAQELIHVKRLRRMVPSKIHKTLLRVKYVLLIYLILRFLVVGEVILVGYTPFHALFHFGGTGLSIVLTILTALLSLVIFRPFCQYLCPLGALLGFTASFRHYSILPKNCTSCGYCTKKCPLLAIEKGVVNKRECLLCGECLRVCPRNK